MEDFIVNRGAIGLAINTGRLGSYVWWGRTA